MSTTDLPGSSLLASRYRLVERLGAGGMSVVWRGFDEVLGRQVAVKVLPPSSSADPAFRRRLRAEAQAAARLSHPNITNVYDYGEATTVDGEPVPYVVMELIDGDSLAAVLARVRRLPWQHAVQITAEVAAALAAAHSRGIVHRDVTPANVMLTPTGAKVVDFGISALIGENDIDPDGSLLGTPAYLAPERLDGGQVSPATDVYAVGLLIYRTLIGQLPWDVGTTTALLRAHQYTEPDPLPPVEGLPPAVAALVGRCLEKNPADRPASAELAHVLAGISAGAPAMGPGYTADWQRTGEDTTILPGPSRSFSEVIHGRGQPSGAGSMAVPSPRLASPLSPAAPGAGGAEVYRSAAARSAEGTPAASQAWAGRPATPRASGRESAVDANAAAAGRGNRLAARLSGSALGAAGAERSSQSPSGPAGRRTRPRHGRRVTIAAGAVVALGITVYGISLASAAGRNKQQTAVGVVPATGKCVVSYAVWSDANQQFTAKVTVANRDDTAINAWNLWFIMPGDQQVALTGPMRLVQSGQTVTVNSSAPLPAQKAITMDLQGRYADNNTAPLAFSLNNHTCETFVSSRPGEPVRQVEHLSNGKVRLSTSPTSRTPVPGVSIDATGGVHITPTASASVRPLDDRTTPPTATSTSTSPTPVEPAPPTTTPSPTVTTEAPPPVLTSAPPVIPTTTPACELVDPICLPS